MDSTVLLLLLGVLAAAAAGLWAWRRFAPVSFWYGVGFPLRAVWLYLTWAHVAAGCKLTRKRRRWRLSLDPIPVGGAVAGLFASTATTVIRHERRMRRADVDRAPRVGVIRASALGWKLPVRLHDGQIPADYAAVAERLAHAWRVHAVRVLESRPGRLVLAAIRTDPLTCVEPVQGSGELLRVVPGRLEDGRPWVIDFRTVPHVLVAGATQSGKSNLANALIRGLASQPVALVGFDLKGGVEFTPYKARLSVLATTRPDCITVLDDLLGVLETRMAACRTAGVRNVWSLPEHARPVPVVVLVDEVAELFLMAGKSEKDDIARIGTSLLRVAQLGRAFAVHLIVCGQRIGSDLGPGVTALRSQLSGRVCHRVNDPETATMTLGDLDPAALDAARQIPADTPGICVIAASDGSWHRARSALVTEDQAEHAARQYAHLTPAWADITGTRHHPAWAARPAA